MVIEACFPAFRSLSNLVFSNIILWTGNAETQNDLGSCWAEVVGVKSCGHLLFYLADIKKRRPGEDSLTSDSLFPSPNKNIEKRMLTGSFSSNNTWLGQQKSFVVSTRRFTRFSLKKA